MKKQLLSVAAFAALSSPLLASDQVTLAPLDVLSSPLQNSEQNAPEAVEIYTAEDIEQAHTQSLYEFLNHHTSVVTSPGYGNPFIQKIDMRGYGIGDGYQNVVVAVNGRRMNNVDMVPQLLGSIPPSAIERIEIMKGSGIVTGGDGANAGVINIITKRGGGTSVTLSGGSDNTYKGAFHAAGSGENHSVTFLGEASNSDGPRAVDASGSTDEKKMRNGRLDFTYTPLDALELRAALQVTETATTYAGFLSRSEYDADPSQYGLTNWGATEQTYDSRVLDLGATYDLSDVWSFNADVGREKKKSHYVTYASTAWYVYDHAKLSGEYADGGLNVTAGVDYFDGTRQAAVDTDKRNLAGFVMAQQRLGDHTLKAGYRYEEVTYDNRNDPEKSKSLHGVELGYNLLLDAKQSLFANYTHSYQSADLDRMFSFFTGAFTGFVEPAEVDGYNAGYTLFTASNKFKATLFYSDLKNEIYYYADPTWVSSRNTNIDKSHKYGVELYDKWQFASQWSLSVNYSYVRAIIDEETENGENYDGNDLPGVSKHNAKVTLGFHPDAYTTCNVTQRYRSEAYAANDFGNSFSQKQEAFESTDVSMTYARDTYELFVKINNLFDRSNGIWIQDDAIYPSEFKRTVHAGLTLKY